MKEEGEAAGKFLPAACHAANIWTTSFNIFACFCGTGIPHLLWRLLEQGRVRMIPELRRGSILLPFLPLPSSRRSTAERE